ncbi:conserved hypothetical protein [Cyanobium sp. PCC 7001]|uniref:hypothetical protein n=1 Tax=Cyanobium sp. PCC 7001 TaxID=180281 RepID=UPI0001805407|nr:hypothetical protein [Cyanobium sp. PCC 7001]EDY39692.1 conserved hypothetical protein [Cyanobium sp. PCC 7001]
MAAKRSTAHAAATQADPMHDQSGQVPMSDWLAAASAQGIKPEQALAIIGLGLMQKMAGSSEDLPWVWNEVEDGGSADLSALRQRLELVNLALQTGAPLSTAEVTVLLGARPGAPVVERGGLRARRLSRNVWKLTKADSSSSTFNDGFRRRL